MINHTPEHFLLLKELRRIVDFPDKDFLKLTPLLEKIHVRKNEHLFSAGQISRRVYFIVKGCLRQYIINNDGDERNIYFKIESGWCSELQSFLNDTPTELNLQALENSDLLEMNQKNWIYAAEADICEQSSAWRYS